MKKDYWFWIVVAMLALGMIYFVIGCNAINGLGQDIITVTEPYTTGQ